MRKMLCVFIFIFLLSLSVVGCANITSYTTEASVNDIEQSSEKELSGNYFEINGIMKNIGDYKKIENSFLVDFYKNYLPDINKSEGEVFIYDTSDITEDMLNNRKGTVIIERCIGMVTNKATGDGQILNSKTEDGNGCYISYRNEKCQELNLCDGTILVSYMIYNPDNNVTDDIIERYDFVVCREYED